jgi:hypothetical protein
MAEDQRLSAADYLDRFFDELRSEVRANPKLAERLVKALGGEVVFDQDVRAEVANPYQLAGAAPKSQFYAVYSNLKTSQLRKVLKDYNLATGIDMSGKSAGQLVDMLYTRAAAKVGERKSSMF